MNPNGEGALLLPRVIEFTKMSAISPNVLCYTDAVHDASYFMYKMSQHSLNRILLPKT